MLRISLSSFLFVAFMVLNSCDENNNLVLFSIQNDKDLGAQVSAEINNDPNFNLLSRAEYPEAYAYMDDMVNEILNNGDLAYRDEFVWDVTIVHDDEVLNAFATPGGYIYVYTGLIHYLETVDDLAGVMGHEIAHADLRHTSRNMQKVYGIQVLLSVILGQDSGALTQIASDLAAGVASLRFSREFESEADARAVEYNQNTKYSCDAVKNFFQKLLDEGQSGSGPEFLSTHPSPDNRVEAISTKASQLGCNTEFLNNSGYEAFKAS